MNDSRGIDFPCDRHLHELMRIYLVSEYRKRQRIERTVIYPISRVKGLRWTAAENVYMLLKCEWCRPLCVVQYCYCIEETLLLYATHSAST